MHSFLKSRLSEAIAGSTLLALANGAPDIISSLTAAGETDGIFIGVGGLVGSCAFGSTIVLGTCILKSRGLKGVQMDKNEWIRDLVFYIFALLYLLYMGLKGEITHGQSLGFIFLYLVYLGVIFYVKLKINSNPCSN